MFRRQKSVVGLDIGSSAVKAVALRPIGKEYRITAFGIEPIPPESIVDGAIVDGGAVSDAIRQLFQRQHIKTKDVVASVSGNAVIVKRITVPVMTDEELADSIYWEAEQYVPFDIQDVNLDYQIVDGLGADPRGTMDVLLVAAKKNKIADYVGVIAQAGRVPVIIDVDAFALQHAYQLNYDTDPSAVISLLNAGASAVNINVVQGEETLFTRNISMGGNAYTEALQRELHLPFESADQLKRRVPVPGASYEEALPVIRSVTESITLEVEKTFDNFKATASSDRMDRIIVSGGASGIEGFSELLAERFGASVEAFDPFRRVTFDASAFGVEPAKVGPMAAIAVGLAARRVGDR